MTDTQFLKTVGSRIKEKRLKRKMSQQALADLCDMDDTSVCLIEGGRVNCHLLTLRRISEVLNADIKYFITLENGKEKDP